MEDRGCLRPESAGRCDQWPTTGVLCGVCEAKWRTRDRTIEGSRRVLAQKQKQREAQMDEWDRIYGEQRISIFLRGIEPPLDRGKRGQRQAWRTLLTYVQVLAGLLFLATLVIGHYAGGIDPVVSGAAVAAYGLALGSYMLLRSAEEEPAEVESSVLPKQIAADAREVEVIDGLVLAQEEIRRLDLELDALTDETWRQEWRLGWPEAEPTATPRRPRAKMERVWG